MEDQQRRVNNQLFTPSVTGSTLEEFSQRAMIFPAQEVLPPQPQLTPPLSATPGPGMTFYLLHNRVEHQQLYYVTQIAKQSFRTRKTK